jgi:uncharacterized protein YoxC
LIKKTTQLADTIQEIQNGCDQLLTEGNGIDFEKLLKLQESVRDVITKMHHIQQNIESDERKVQTVLGNSSEDSGSIMSLYQLHKETYLVCLTDVRLKSQNTIDT